MITQQLSQALFHGSDPLGQQIYFHSTYTPSRIVGVVERAQNSRAAAMANRSMAEQVTFMPYHFINGAEYYVVRSSPGQLAHVMHSVQAKLFAQSSDRAIENLMPFSETRKTAYVTMRASLGPLIEVGVVLLAVSICGVFGLTSYSVHRRRRYIGMRRALGATRADILWYFHIENLLIAGAGCALGVILGISGNTWLAINAQVSRAGAMYMVAGAGVLLVFAKSRPCGPRFEPPPSLPPVRSEIRRLYCIASIRQCDALDVSRTPTAHC